MKLFELQNFLSKALSICGGDAEVLLCFEEAVYEDGYSEEHTEGISDIRLVNDWPLPGTSIITHEGEIKQKVVIFYDNHFKLDSSSNPA